MRHGCCHVVHLPVVRWQVQAITAQTALWNRTRGSWMPRRIPMCRVCASVYGCRTHHERQVYFVTQSQGRESKRADQRVGKVGWEVRTTHGDGGRDLY